MTGTELSQVFQPGRTCPTPLRLKRAINQMLMLSCELCIHRGKEVLFIGVLGRSDCYGQYAPSSKELRNINKLPAGLAYAIVNIV